MEDQEDLNPSHYHSMPQAKHSLSKVFGGVVVVIFMIVTCVAGYFLVQRGSIAPSPIIEDNSSIQTQLENSEPFLFQDMTIPYLREKAYEGALTSLEEVSSNSDYMSYRTTYISDGLTIYAQITKPANAMPEGGFPAIIFVHGYIPPARYQTFSNYASYVDALARSGFVVFKIDLRGHGESEGEPSGAYYSGDYVVDILNARAALRVTEFVNPEKIGLWGHSMAGNVGLRSFVVARDMPAISLWSGAVYTYEDLGKYGISDASYQPPDMNSERQKRREMLREMYGEFDKNSEFWSQVVPINYLDDVRGAIQLNHAVDDDVVNSGYSRDLNILLDNTDIVHEFNEYSSGGHNLSGSTFTRAMNDTIKFFHEHL